jgi:hypothetical protein
MNLLHLLQNVQAAEANKGWRHYSGKHYNQKSNKHSF